MTTDTAQLNVEIAAIKAEHDAATRARIRAEHLRDTAAAQANALHAQLKSDFGVETLQEAETMLATLDAELADAIRELREQLRAAGGNA